MSDHDHDHEFTLYHRSLSARFEWLEHKKKRLLPAFLRDTVGLTINTAAEPYDWELRYKIRLQEEYGGIGIQSQCVSEEKEEGVKKGGEEKEGEVNKGGEEKDTSAHHYQSLLIYFHPDRYQEDPVLVVKANQYFPIVRAWIKDHNVLILDILQRAKNKWLVVEKCGQLHELAESIHTLESQNWTRWDDAAFRKTFLEETCIPIPLFEKEQQKQLERLTKELKRLETNREWNENVVMRCNDTISLWKKPNY
jgi:hypothetical protein